MQATSTNYTSQLVNDYNSTASYNIYIYIYIYI